MTIHEEYLQLLGFFGVIQRIWSSLPSTVAAPQQPRGIMTVVAVDIPDYWQSWHHPPTHTCHTVSAGRHVRPQTDRAKVLLVPSFYLAVPTPCSLYLVTMGVFLLV